MPDKYKFTWADKNAFLRELKQLLISGDEREFMRVLRSRGIKDEDPRFVELLKLFRNLRSGKP